MPQFNYPLAAIENAEADSWAEIQAAALEFHERFGVSVARICGAVVITAPKSDMPAINRAWLPGQSGRLSPEIVAAVCDHARERGVAQLLLHVAPWSHEQKLALDAAKEVTPMIKLVRPATVGGQQPPTRLAIRETRDATLFGEIAAAGNEAPTFMAAGFNSTVGCDGWRHYLAFDGQTPVAAAAVRFHADVAWCCFAGTVPEHRGKGAQRALLTQRVVDAASVGCAWVTCESLPGRPDAPSFSLANMLAVGFTPAYTRPSILIDLTRPAS